jgi:phage gpG-like protein
MFVLLASVTMPARPFLGINAEDRTEAIELCRQWLVEGST